MFLKLFGEHTTDFKLPLIALEFSYRKNLKFHNLLDVLKLLFEIL